MEAEIHLLLKKFPSVLSVVRNLSEEMCHNCKKEPINGWIPEFNVCNSCLAKGFFPVPDEPSKGENLE